jgi:tRNA1Val (adenine37-N6)-methyltransferase
MKVGVDGVTLGAWADIAGAKSILDVGCGSGLIALMLAQRSAAKITAIDIDEQSIVQAEENVKNSPWRDRISILHHSFQDFAAITSESFDLIVSNPPFFVNSLKTPSQARTTARHNDSLSHADIIQNAKKCMKKSGRLCLILPILEGNQFVDSAEKEGLFCSKKISLFPNPTKPAKRFLLEFRFEQAACEESDLTIEKERNVYTAEYEDIVKDFYLYL